MQSIENYKHLSPQDSFAGFSSIDIFGTAIVFGAAYFGTGDAPTAFGLGGGTFGVLQLVKARQRPGFIRRLVIYMTAPRHGRLGRAKPLPRMKRNRP